MNDDHKPIMTLRECMDAEDNYQDMDDWPFVNGTVWYHPTWCHYVVLTYLCGHEPAWVLLSIETNTTHGGWAVIAIAEKDGRDRYSFEDLPQRLKEWDCQGVWKPTEHNQYGTLNTPQDREAKGR